MTPRRLEVTVWVLLYGGLACVIVGLWSLDGAGYWPRVLIVAGLALCAVGVLLIWLRSRLAEPGPREIDR